MYLMVVRRCSGGRFDFRKGTSGKAKANVALAVFGFRRGLFAHQTISAMTEATTRVWTLYLTGQDLRVLRVTLRLELRTRCGDGATGVDGRASVCGAKRSATTNTEISL